MAVIVGELFSNVSGELFTCMSIHVCIIRFVKVLKKKEKNLQVCKCIDICKCVDKSVNVYIDING